MEDLYRKRRGPTQQPDGDGCISDGPERRPLLVGLPVHIPQARRQGMRGLVLMNLRFRLQGFSGRCNCGHPDRAVMQGLGGWGRGVLFRGAGNSLGHGSSTFDFCGASFEAFSTLCRLNLNSP